MPASRSRSFVCYLWLNNWRIGASATIAASAGVRALHGFGFVNGTTHGSAGDLLGIGADRLLVHAYCFGSGFRMLQVRLHFRHAFLCVFLHVGFLEVLRGFLEFVDVLRVVFEHVLRVGLVKFRAVEFLELVLRATLRPGRRLIQSHAVSLRDGLEFLLRLLMIFADHLGELFDLGVLGLLLGEVRQGDFCLIPFRRFLDEARGFMRGG